MRTLTITTALCFLLASSTLLSGCVTTQPANQTPTRKLELAVKSRNKALVEKLIAEGAVPGEGSSGILDDGFGWAEHYGDRDIMNMLVKKCQEAYVQGQNCLTAPCYVARRGNAASLTAFLARGLDVNTEMTGTGATLLVCAASEGNMPNVKFLIEKGADIDKALSTFESSNVQLAAQNSARRPRPWRNRMPQSLSWNASAPVGKQRQRQSRLAASRRQNSRR